MIELDVLAPAELNRTSVPVVYLLALKASRDVESGCETRHRLLKLGAIFGHVVVEQGRAIVCDDRRETGLEMVDEYGPTTKLADAKLLASFHNGVGDLLSEFDWPLQLKADFASHSLS